MHKCVCACSLHVSAMNLQKPKKPLCTILCAKSLDFQNLCKLNARTCKVHCMRHKFFGTFVQNILHIFSMQNACRKILCISHLHSICKTFAQGWKRRAFYFLCYDEISSFRCFWISLFLFDFYWNKLLKNYEKKTQKGKNKMEKRWISAMCIMILVSVG